jgi:anthranilate synthase component 2
MIKVIAIAVWICAATLGAVFYSFQAAGEHGVGETPKPMLGGLDYVKTDIISVPLIRRFAGDIPILGVCLGHQAIGQHFGGRIVRAPAAMHGKVSAIDHDGSGVFAGLPSPFAATRYHSLCVAPESMPDCLIVNARAGDETVQGCRHRTLPIHGVQFHPESIASEHGHVLLANFLALVRTAAAADA